MHKLASKGAVSVFLISFASVIFMFAGSISTAQPASWVSPELPFVQVGEDNITSKYLMPGNRTCYDTILQELVFVPALSQVPTEKLIQKCAVINQLGTFAGDYLSPNTRHAFKIFNVHGVVGVPNQPVFLYMDSTGGLGRNVRIYRDIRGNGDFHQLKTVNQYSGHIYNLTKFPAPLVSSTNQTLGIREFAFSNNGEWMVAEVLGVGFARINLLSGGMSLFSSEVLDYNQGSLRPNATLAISNDGKHVIKSGEFSRETTVYDVSACQGNLETVLSTKPASGCNSKSLHNFLSKQVSGFQYLQSMRFSENGRMIKGVVTKNEGSKYVNRQIILSLDQILPVTEASYLAMGDSFASGEGDGDKSQYEDGTDDKGVNMCHLSKRSYPYLISANLQISDFHNVACSGAIQKHVFSELQYPESIENSPLGEWIPGKKLQKNYISQSQSPSFITISIGGNDLGFSSILKECIGLGTCDYAKNQQARSAIAQKIGWEYKNLKDLYGEIANRTNRKTKIYVVGYPIFIKEDSGNCGSNVHLDDQERWFIYKSIQYMNQVIKSAAESAGAYYLDIEDSLRSRNLCSEIPANLMTVNGVTEGDDIGLPWYADIVAHSLSAQGGRVDLYNEIGFSNGSFHPNQNAQELIKTSILSQTLGDPASFAYCSDPSLKVCPTANNSVPVPDVDYFGIEAHTFVDQLNNPIPRTPLLVPEERNLVQELESPLSARIIVANLAANSDVSIVIKSEPVSLGNFRTTGEGKLDVILSIPEIVQPGFHKIHIYGKNIAGQSIEYYQPVFIAGPEGDVNSNGVLDSEEPCGFVEPSKEDIDKDGIDDGCDATIGDPPAPSIELPEIGPIDLPNFKNITNTKLQNLGETRAGYEELVVVSTELASPPTVGSVFPPLPAFRSIAPGNPSQVLGAISDNKKQNASINQTGSTTIGTEKTTDINTRNISFIFYIAGPLLIITLFAIFRRLNA